MKYIALSFSIFIISTIGSQNEICHHADPYGHSREKNIRPLDLQLNVRLIEKEGRVDGKATYLFTYLRKEIDTVFFDGIEMEFKSIKVNGENIRFRKDSNGVTMFLPKNRPDTNLLEIIYTAWPLKGMYFLNWNNSDSKAYRQIWTQGQGIDNRHWIPGFDNAANLQTVTNKITFNENYPVVSNGNLISKTQNSDKTITWTYQINAPHALYLIMIAAGDYKMKTQKSKGGVQLDQYYYPDYEANFEATYQYSEPMMDWFEKEIGVDYPWGKIYRNVPTRDFLYGAMENTSSTIFADYMHQNWRCQLERAYLNVNAHELAHQWFGDLITERNMKHHWLHESFATHYSKKFVQSIKGNNEWDWIRKGELDAAFQAGKSNSLPVANGSSGSPRHYPKGSYVLDMLRKELGNENYRKSIKAYLLRHYHENVETQDLIAAIYETTGRNVDWFFDQWIFRGGEPNLSVNHKLNGSTLELSISQIHKKEPTVTAFRLPMNAVIYYKSGQKMIVTCSIENEQETFRYALDPKEEFDYIVLDENMEFLRKIEYAQGSNYDLHILRKNRNTLCQLEAIERLNKTTWDIKKKDYLNTFHREPSALIRREILQQLSLVSSDEIMEDIIHHGLTDNHHLVRRAAIASVNIQNAMLKDDLTKLVNDSSYINIEHAVTKLSTLYPSEENRWLSSLEGIDGINHNLSILYHSKALKKDGQIQVKAFQALKRIASESSEYRSRIPAMQVLMDQKLYDEEFVKNLIQGSFYFHPGIRNASISHLKQIKQENKILFQKVVSTYPFSSPRYTQKILFDRIGQ